MSRIRITIGIILEDIDGFIDIILEEIHQDINDITISRESIETMIRSMMVMH
ncbi:MAG TPA: hypothetical protein VE870_09795 [Bacteroidales bacterium]|nr:hypothetical protein [Bacteroidales bacterium]